MRGRKPTPSALAELHGRPSKRKPNPREPRPHGDLTEPPENLNEVQRAAWDYIISSAPPAMLKRLDRGALTAFVIASDLHRQAVLKQNAAGGLILTQAGALIPSPYIAIINRQGLIALRASAELGFTPASRPRIGGRA